MASSSTRINPLLFSFLNGGRCENALLERFSSAICCPDSRHEPFWALQETRPSDLSRLLTFERHSAAWIDAFPAIVGAACRLHGAQPAQILSLAEALIGTQECHCVGVALRCLEVGLRAFPEKEVVITWQKLLQHLFALKTSLNDVNLPHAIDGLLALFFMRNGLEGEAFLSFFSGESATQLLCEDAVFDVAREIIRLCAREGRSFCLPACPLPEIPGAVTSAQVSKLTCLCLLQQREADLVQLLTFAEDCWTRRELWQLLMDCVQFFEFTAWEAPESAAFLSFALRFVGDCLHDSCGLRSHRCRLEAILRSFCRRQPHSEAFDRLLDDLSPKFLEAMTQGLPTFLDLSRLLRLLPLPSAVSCELLEAVLEAWEPLMASGTLRSDADLAIFCELALALAKNAGTAEQLVLRLLNSTTRAVEGCVSDPERAYGCHFLMFLWRDAAALLGSATTDRAQLSEAVRSGVLCQVRYGEVFCRLDHFPCPCFAPLQGAAALLLASGGATEPEVTAACEHLCKLFEGRSVDSAFLDAMLVLALRASIDPNPLLAPLERLCAATDAVRLQARSLDLLLTAFLEAPEVKPLGALLRASFRPAPELSHEKVDAARRKMGEAWGDVPDSWEHRLCDLCGEDLQELCSDVELSLQRPLNLDCIGD